MYCLHKGALKLLEDRENGYSVSAIDFDLIHLFQRLRKINYNKRICKNGYIS